LEPWEERLSALALTSEDDGEWGQSTVVERERLQQAYRVCERMTRDHSHTFHLAAKLLPASKRQAAHALYAFCRCTDDAVDLGGSDAQRILAHWKEKVLGPVVDQASPVILAWRDTAARYQIPRRYVQQLLAGVAQDLSVKRYSTFDELAFYCYSVASTVGLMLMSIIGYAGNHAMPSAIKLGVALQLTNILRDVREDWTAGRLYLPQEELHAFGVSENSIAKGVVDDHWCALMRFQIARARKLYAESLPAIAHLERAGRFAVAAAAELYRAILNDIERHGYDVFNHRAYVGTPAKLLRLPGIFLRTLTMTY